MGWWKPECPVRPAEQTWIERELDWLVREYGPERLHGEVVLPTDDYFPGAYHGIRDDVTSVLHRLCAHMDIDPSRVLLVFDDEDDNPELSAYVPVRTQWNGAAGHHSLHAGRSVVGVNDKLATQPMALVATLAHELGHVLLLGDGRISSDREDHEPLTDLLTVYFGLGLFAANAAFDYSREDRGRYSYSRSSRLGYLTEPMYGYALARYAWLRGETAPGWSRYLDANPRSFFKRGLRYLAAANAGADLA